MTSTVMPTPSRIVEDSEAVAKKGRVNVVLEDNPERWLITVTRLPADRGVGVLTETITIETEPSLWFRSDKWQEFEDGDKDKPLYKAALILMVHYIGR